MSILDHTQPYYAAVQHNAEQIFKIATWLRENPDAHLEVRAEKFRSWQMLDRECALMFKMWDAARDRYLAAESERSNGDPPVSGLQSATR